MLASKKNGHRALAQLQNLTLIRGPEKQVAFPRLRRRLLPLLRIETRVRSFAAPALVYAIDYPVVNLSLKPTHASSTERDAARKFASRLEFVNGGTRQSHALFYLRQTQDEFGCQNHVSHAN